MAFVDYPQLAPLDDEWIWANRHRVYRVRFVDGDEYLMSAVLASQDIGAPPHATANVDETVRRADSKGWNRKDAIFFHLLDVAEVTEVESGRVVFSAA